MKMFSKNFKLLVAGQVISIFGSAILKFALSLYVLDISGRADIFATLLAISIVPGIILAPFGGAFADRFNRRNMMVGFDLFSCAVVILFTFVLFTGEPSIALIGLTITLLTLVSSLYQPTVRASIPAMMHDDQLAKANGIIGGVAALANLAGPVIGGLSYNFFSLDIMVITGAAAFFLSAMMELLIDIPFISRRQTGSMLTSIFSDMKDGLHFVFREKPYIARTMVLASSLNLLLTPYFVIGIPCILRMTMGSSDAAYGAAMGMIQLSGIAGALSVDRFSRKLKLDSLPRWISLIAVMTLPMALSLSPYLLGLGYWPAYIFFLIFALPVVMILAMLSVFAVTIVQKETPNALLGKVLAIIGTAAQAAAPLGQLLYGYLFQVFSIKVYIPTLMAGLGTLGLAFLAYILLNRRGQRLDMLKSGIPST